MVSEERMSLPERFMSLQKITMPTNWIEKKKAAGHVIYDEVKPITEVLKEIGNKTLVILKKADKTCFYQLYDEFLSISENFKIYNVGEKKEWFVIEVKNDGTE